MENKIPLEKDEESHKCDLENKGYKPSFEEEVDQNMESIMRSYNKLKKS